MASANYDIVGQHYSTLRQPDPRIAKFIHAELEESSSIINIGAGTGSYEPEGKQIVAVEPSQKMLSQRKNKDNTKTYCASAENLPFPSNEFDSSLAILTLHHWNDWRKGIREAQRVSKSKFVLFTWVGMPNDFWLFNYFPEIENIDKHLFPTLEELSSELQKIEVTVVPIPSDCTDGFLCAYWAKPEKYLDEKIRSAISTFSRIKNIEKGIKKLSKHLESGEWHKRYGHLQSLSEADFGYRLVVAKKQGISNT